MALDGGGQSDADLFTGTPAQPAAVVFQGSGADPSLGDPTGQQAATYRQLAAAGGIDPNAPAGSPRHPMGVSAAGGDVPEGAFYVDNNGLIKRAPPGGAHFAPQGGISQNDPNAPAAAVTAAEAPAPAPAAAKGLSDADLFPASAPAQTDIQKAAKALQSTLSPEGQAVAEGTTMGFLPEVHGAEAYVGTAISNALAQMQGQKPTTYSPGEAYQAVTDADRAMHEDFQKAHPKENIALGIAGSVANPINAASGDFIGAAPTVLGAVGRGALVGAGTGAVTGAGEAGGDLENRLKGAEGGAVTGALAGGVLGGGGRMIANAIPTSAARIAQNTSAANDALAAERLGTLPPETTGAIGQSIAAGGHPVNSAFRGVAETLPTPVPLSAGQAARDPALQMEESLALKGAKGTPAQQTAANFRQTQQAALQANTQQIRQIVSGGQGLEPGEGAANVSSQLNEGRDQLKSAVDVAYDRARAAPGAALTPGGASTIRQALAAGIKDYDPRNIPKVARELQNIEAALAPKAAPVAAPGAPASVMGADLSKFSPEVQARIAASTGGTLAKTPGIQPTGNAVRDLFDARARLTKLAAPYPPTVESSAARAVVQQLDAAIDGAVKGDLFQGNPAGVQAWKDAIGARRAFGRLFEGNDLIDTLTDRIDRGGVRGALKVPPDQALNYIMGREGLAGLGGINARRDIGRLGDVLGRTGTEWQGLKGDFVDRIFQQGLKTAPGGGTEISGAKLATVWNAAQRKYGGVMDELLTPSERDLISRFVTTAHVATEPLPGGINRSDTFTGLAQMAHKAAPSVLAALVKIPGVGPLLQAAKDAGANSTIRAATFGASVRPAPSAGGLNPNALAGFAGQQGAGALTQQESRHP